MPPALLTNDFANPLEVCAAGAIIMTPSRPLLQRTSLCCAKMPVSVLDDGGEVMAIARWSRRFSPPPVRRQPRAVSVSALFFALCPFWAPKGPGACGPGPSFFLGARWMGFQSPKEGSGTYVPAVVLTYTVAKECSRPPSRGHVASIHPVS